MRVSARRFSNSTRHELEIGGVSLAAGDDGPTPQELLAGSLAFCTAMTMERYAKRKGWNIGDVVVEVDYEPAQRGSPTRCATIVRLANSLSKDQRDRLLQVAAKSPVHRTLEGEILFDERVELSAAAAAPPTGQRADDTRGRRSWRSFPGLGNRGQPKRRPRANRFSQTK